MPVAFLCLSDACNWYDMAVQFSSNAYAELLKRLDCPFNIIPGGTTGVKCQGVKLTGLVVWMMLGSIFDPIEKVH